MIITSSKTTPITALRMVQITHFSWRRGRTEGGRGGGEGGKERGGEREREGGREGERERERESGGKKKG